MFCTMQEIYLRDITLWLDTCSVQGRQLPLELGWTMRLSDVTRVCRRGCSWRRVGRRRRDVASVVISQCTAVRVPPHTLPPLVAASLRK